jgi:hypothetical protein
MGKAIGRYWIPAFTGARGRRARRPAGGRIGVRGPSGSAGAPLTRIMVGADTLNYAFAPGTFGLLRTRSGYDDCVGCCHCMLRVRGYDRDSLAWLLLRLQGH